MNYFSDIIPGLILKVYSGEGYEIKAIEGVIQLKAWSDYKNSQVAYELDSRIEVFDGTVKLHIGGDIVLENPEVTQEHANAYNYLVQNQDKIRDNILAELGSHYKELQSLYSYDEEDARSIIPHIDDVNQFRSLIGLSTVHLLNVSKDGTSYVGYQFDCSWDDEHGLGFMTYKDKVIKVGGADTSFLTWIAEDDMSRR